MNGLVGGPLLAVDLGPSAEYASNHEHDVCQPQPLQTSSYTQLLTVQTSQS